MGPERLKVAQEMVAQAGLPVKGEGWAQVELAEEVMLAVKEKQAQEGLHKRT